MLSFVSKTIVTAFSKFARLEIVIQSNTRIRRKKLEFWRNFYILSILYIDVTLFVGILLFSKI